MTLPTPFQDDAESAAIGHMTIENGRDRIVLYGNLEITRDKAGLTLARQIADFLTRIVGILSADPNLPEKILPPDKPKTVPNPFA